MSTSRKRVRRCDVTEEIWTQHRKLRKKIASAKWYAKKKKAEIDEEHRVRGELALKLLPKPEDPIWPDRVVFSHWHAALDSELRGYPLRPSVIPVETWVQGTQLVERWLCYHLRCMGDRGCGRDVHIPWESCTFGTSWRQLAMGEWVHSYRTGTPWLGWTCSLLGAVFVAWHLRQKQLSFGWQAVARAMTQVITISTMSVHIQPNPHPPHIHPPNQNPVKNATRNDGIGHANDPPNSVTWCEWVHWMNRALFDEWVDDWDVHTEDEYDPDFSDTLADADDENYDWMDAYIQPFLNCEVQPSSLDHLSSGSTHLHESEQCNDSIGNLYDEQSHTGPAHSTEYEPSCWISDPTDLLNINGNVHPASPDHRSPTNV